MSTLLIDAGNSRFKWSLLSQQGRSHQESLSYKGNQPEAALYCLGTLLQQQVAERLVLVHVLGEIFSERLEEICQGAGIELLIVRSVEQAYGVSNAYELPAHLGADRFVGLVAAHQQAKQASRPAVMIDCGTAITLDTVTVSGKHLGGLIIPGLQLMSRSLIEKTQASHMNSSQFEGSNVFTRNTNTAMGSGCLYAVVCAIEGICQRIEQTIGEKTHKILCGGDAPLIYAELLQPYSYQLQADALMDGLQVIAEQA